MSDLRNTIVRLPPGRASTNVELYGNTVYLSQSAVKVQMKLIGSDLDKRLVFNRGQGIKINQEFQRIEMSRSDLDTNPDAEYIIEIMAGTLDPGERLFF